jgi:hypothetical protein
LKKRTKKLLLLGYGDGIVLGIAVCGSKQKKVFWFFFSKNNTSSFASLESRLTRLHVIGRQGSHHAQSNSNLPIHFWTVSGFREIATCHYDYECC